MRDAAFNVITEIAEADVGVRTGTGTGEEHHKYLYVLQDDLSDVCAELFAELVLLLTTITSGSQSAFRTDPFANSHYHGVSEYVWSTTTAAGAVEGDEDEATDTTTTVAAVVVAVATRKIKKMISDCFHLAQEDTSVCSKLLYLLPLPAQYRYSWFEDEFLVLLSEQADAVHGLVSPSGAGAGADNADVQTDPKYALLSLSARLDAFSTAVERRISGENISMAALWLQVGTVESYMR